MRKVGVIEVMPRISTILIEEAITNNYTTNLPEMFVNKCIPLSHQPVACPPFVAIKINAMMQGAGPRLTQLCIVPL